MACHSADGGGIPTEFPRLAGQHAQYVVAQLQAFRSGARANDPNAMMQTIASKLSDNEMKAVAQYISGLH
jgi:cytochrome c553